MSDYRATGTGEYGFYKDCKIVHEYSNDLQELIIEYIRHRKTVDIDSTQYFTIRQ